MHGDTKILGGQLILHRQTAQTPPQTAMMCPCYAGLLVNTAEERSLNSVDWQHLGPAWRSMLEIWLMSIMKALWGTLSASVVTMRVKILSVRPTVASAAGTNDLHEKKDAP